uniref:Uncharacterized protein n=1 Tax=Nelumbo nucifera TaxID=4432 RepID=A0A822ZLL1_NELNU|nr:TPA_asm: hypothetical protein HUJ06_016891 [Nelumbo nucifera]
MVQKERLKPDLGPKKHWFKGELSKVRAQRARIIINLHQHYNQLPWMKKQQQQYYLRLRKWRRHSTKQKSGNAEARISNSSVVEIRRCPPAKVVVGITNVWISSTQSEKGEDCSIQCGESDVGGCPTPQMAQESKANEKAARTKHTYKQCGMGLAKLKLSAEEKATSGNGDGDVAGEGSGSGGGGKQRAEVMQGKEEQADEDLKNGEDLEQKLNSLMRRWIQQSIQEEANIFNAPRSPSIDKRGEQASSFHPFYAETSKAYGFNF